MTAGNVAARSRLLAAAQGALGACIAMVTFAAPAAAQVANPSAAALGLGENYTAAARGYAAVAWNPAGLALTGNPGFSLTILPVRAVAGLGPVTLGELAEYENELVPTEVKRQWLADIRDSDGQSGTGGSDVTWLGLQAGPVALQVSTSVRAVADVSPGVSELILFGNADEQGAPRDLVLDGSEMNVNAYSTGALSYALPFDVGAGARLAVGATAKYTVGHVLAAGRNSTGRTTSDPIGVEFSFPVVHTFFGDDDADIEAINGAGFGLDLGVGYETGAWTFAATAQNVVSTFEWDEENLRYRPATLVFNEDERETEFDEQPLSQAPASAREIADDMTFKPSFAAGALMRFSEKLTFTADARFGGTGGLTTRPPTLVGAGMELRAVSWLPLRVGAAFVQLDDDHSGVQGAAGLGLKLGPFNVSASAAHRRTGLGSDTFGMLSLVSVGI